MSHREWTELLLSSEGCMPVRSPYKRVVRMSRKTKKMTYGLFSNV